MSSSALSEFAPIPVQVTHRRGRDEVVSLSLGVGATASACSGAGGKKPPEVRSFEVLDVAEVVARERELESQGTPLSELMERAGASLAAFVSQAFSAPARILILCGSGNNGGDGWVAARLLAEEGFEVELVSLRAPEDLRAEPARSAAIRASAVAQRVPDASALLGIAGGEAPAVFRFGNDAFGFESCDAIVDCLLGTGFGGGAVKEPARALIERANAVRAFKIACDVPSGMSAQTAEVGDACFRADATITMIAVKAGLARSDAEPFTGRLLVAPLV